MSYFKASEFKCKCGKCEGGVMDAAFLSKLERARIQANTVFVITSGFRCASHNKTVGGKPASAHLEGKAADISYSDSNKAFLILKALIDAGFTRIGHNPKRKFFHVDTSEKLLQNLFFDY